MEQECVLIEFSLFTLREYENEYYAAVKKNAVAEPVALKLRSVAPAKLPPRISCVWKLQRVVFSVASLHTEKYAQTVSVLLLACFTASLLVTSR